MTAYCIERWQVEARTGWPTIIAVYGVYADRETAARALHAMTPYPLHALRIVTTSNGRLVEVAHEVGVEYEGALPLAFAEESQRLLLPNAEASV